MTQLNDSPAAGELKLFLLFWIFGYFAFLISLKNKEKIDCIYFLMLKFQAQECPWPCIPGFRKERSQQVRPSGSLCSSVGGMASSWLQNPSPLHIRAQSISWYNMRAFLKAHGKLILKNCKTNGNPCKETSLITLWRMHSVEDCTYFLKYLKIC